MQALQQQRLPTRTPFQAASRARLTVVARAASKTKAKQAWVCLDCGYIYPGNDFEKLPNSYRCPVCLSPKRRFKLKEVGQGKRGPVVMGDKDGEFEEDDKLFFAFAVVAGAAVLGGLYFYLNSQTGGV